MTKAKYLTMLLMVAVILGFTGCSDDDEPQMPQFGAITISPEKDVYQVGDEVVCTITMTSEAGPEMKKATWWWYASWWFSNPELTADFSEFNDGKCVSSPITLTEAGDVNLYFFGRVEFPNFDWRKVEIAKTVKVAETPQASSTIE